MHVPELKDYISVIFLTKLREQILTHRANYTHMLFACLYQMDSSKPLLAPRNLR